MSNFIKSPLNYVGGKFKLLPQIIPLMPTGIDTFVDLFGGGANVAVNAPADKVIYNDIEATVVDFLINVSQLSPEDAVAKIDSVVAKYGLSKTNEQGYYDLRNDYNNGLNSWDMFYAMVTHAFNYQIRFNRENKFNMPFGKNRSSFNPALRKKFIAFVEALNKKDITFINKDFRAVDFSNLTANSFVYIDSPYLITVASYNENGGWTEQDERDLYSLADALNGKGIKFGLSNVMYHKGKENTILKEWSSKYNVHELDYNYSNSNYHTKDRKPDSSLEVYICNY